MSLFGSKKQNEIDKLVNENDELKNQLHSVLLKQGSYEELENNLAHLKAEFTGLQQKDDSLFKNIAAHEAGIIEKEKYLQDLNSKILELEEIKENLNSTIRSYDSQVSLLEERAKQLDEKVEHSAEIEIKLAAVSEKKEKLEHDIADKEQTFAYLSTIEREIQTELEKERTELDLVKEQTISMQTEIHALNEAYQESQNRVVLFKQDEEDAIKRINSLNEEEAKKSAYIKTLEEKISLNEEIKSNLESTLGDLVAQLNRNENQYIEHSAKREIIQNDILSLRKERDDMENKLNLAKEQFDIFQSEASKHTALLGTLGGEVSKYEIMRDQIKEEIESLKEADIKYSAEIDLKKNQLDELEISLKGLDELHVRLEKDFGVIIEKYMLDFDDAKLINNELQDDLAEKKAEEAALENSIQEKQSILSEKEGTLRLLKKEYASLEKQTAGLKSEKDNFAEDISLLRENIAKHNSQLTSLRYETEALQIKKSDLQRDLSFLMTQISREYSEAENKLKELNDSISAGKNIFLELDSRISTAKEELKNLKNIQLETGEDSILNKSDELKPAEAELNDGSSDEDLNADGFSSFSLPVDLNDD